MTPSLIALIPARAGSQRVPGKNTRLLAGHPLLAYTIAAAQQSGIFDEIRVCSDDAAALAVGRAMGARTVRRRRSDADECDREWIPACLPSVDAFSILRPTSPFRSAQTMQSAWETFLRHQPADSLRAVRRVTEHPEKMWILEGALSGAPMHAYVAAARHSQPTQSLPSVYVQTSSLEIAWTKTIYDTGTLSGPRVLSFISEGPDGLAIDTEDDWRRAEALLAAGAAQLPALDLAGLPTTAPPEHAPDSRGAVAGRDGPRSPLLAALSESPPA